MNNIILCPRAVRRSSGGRRPAGAPAFFAQPEPELELPFQLQLMLQNKDNILQEWIIVCQVTNLCH